MPVLFGTTSPRSARARGGIQRALGWEQSRLSHHLRRMQRRGLVVREECAGDGRGAYIVVTDAGRQAITDAAPGHVDAVRRFFDLLSPDEVAILEDTASRVLSKLDASPEQRIDPLP